MRDVNEDVAVRYVRDYMGPSDAGPSDYAVRTLVALLREARAEERGRRCPACANVSGALCDAGGVVPDDETAYGAAVRAIVEERDEARELLRRAEAELWTSATPATPRDLLAEIAQQLRGEP